MKLSLGQVLALSLAGLQFLAILIVVSTSYLTSETAMLQHARERLADLIRKAATTPKRRIATRPTYGSVRRRLEGKKQRSEVKRLRGKIDD